MKFQVDTAQVKRYCECFRVWADLFEARKGALNDPKFENARREVELAIHKSCLLSRMVYGGENPSKTKCPVHQGVWSGVHHGWPGTKWHDGTPITEQHMLREWYDAGCRCFQHSCRCTTGWQPDEHCGCVE